MDVLRYAIIALVAGSSCIRREGGPADRNGEPRLEAVRRIRADPDRAPAVGRLLLPDTANVNGKTAERSSVDDVPGAPAGRLLSQRGSNNSFGTARSSRRACR